MNAIEFINELKNPTIMENDMPAKEFFETKAGKAMSACITSKVKMVGNTSFIVTSSSISEIMLKPMYFGRDFFKDMNELGFSYECVGCYMDRVVISTFLFKIN